MQSLVRSLVDVTGSLIGGVTLAKGDQVPARLSSGFWISWNTNPEGVCEAPSLPSGT
jgi:hypothetical protein